MKHYIYKFIFLLFIPALLFADEDLDTCFPNTEELCKLELQIRRDLNYINIPALQWLLFPTEINIHEEVIDVAIIGGGMAGMTTAFALIKEGITNIRIFDECEKEREGPWTKYARMRHLRSNKGIMGPALGVPSLTFRAWYEAAYGKKAWTELKEIPTLQWADYLNWYRLALRLPVLNCMVLKSINPVEDLLQLVFDCKEESCVVYARKVVLATGREGFGGGEAPGFVEHLPKKYYAHTNEQMDPINFAGKNIVVIGAGASAFDAAATGLENGAQSVRMIVRRECIPCVNKVPELSFPGLTHGYYDLSDEMRCKIFSEAFKCGIPPPKDAVERIKNYSNLSFSFNTNVEQAMESGDKIILTTTHGEISCDYLILGTGFAVDGSKREELTSFYESILLWKDKAPQESLTSFSKLGQFPYLGPHFQFLEKVPGEAPFLKHIYCFNYGAFLSHGVLSGDIPGISCGATRLSTGIAADFFLEGSELYYQDISHCDNTLFNPDDYEMFNPND